jgi:hypothetical protein
MGVREELVVGGIEAGILPELSIEMNLILFYR